MEQTTDDLVDQVLSGDTEAYIHIVRRYQTEVRRVIVWTLQDNAATDDLVQEAFVNAYLKLSAFEKGRDFGAWIRTIARNLVRNELRRAGREDKRMHRYRQWLDARLESPDTADAFERELRGHLDACREELAPTASHALALRYDQGMDFSQIAETLGRTVAASRQLLVRVRVALRQCLDDRRTQS